MKIYIAAENEKEKAFAIRFEVFVDEQKVPPEIELDEEDEHAIHIIAEEDGIAVGCARVILSEGEGHIGRLAVKKSYRGRGIGSEICRFIIAYCRERGYKHIWLNAQVRAMPFYEKLGLCPVGDTFEEAGIEHKRMEMKQ